MQSGSLVGVRAHVCMSFAIKSTLLKTFAGLHHDYKYNCTWSDQTQRDRKMNDEAAEASVKFETGIPKGEGMVRVS